MAKETNITLAKQFRITLLKWHKHIDRGMPWKETTDPYKIWLSEVLLQQTTVAQGTPYYLKFINQFPTIQELASAPLDDIYKIWQGLGYYARARNLHSAAQDIIQRFNGIFPHQYTDILSLKGVGPYTAAAIASFAFNLPHAVIDGNVIRFLSRFYGIAEEVTELNTKKKIERLADDLLDKSMPAAYNQALMDFGALQCTPVNPNCNVCPFNKKCIALATNKISEIPYKKSKAPKQIRFFQFLFITDGKKTFLVKRTQKDVWHGLFTFPIIESEKALKQKALIIEMSEIFKTDFGYEPQLISTQKQELTHQRIHGLFYKMEVNHINKINFPSAVQINLEQINNFALPRIMVEFVNKFYL